jgi:hypothetical protein
MKVIFFCPHLNTFSHNMQEPEYFSFLQLQEYMYIPYLFYTNSRLAINLCHAQAETRMALTNIAAILKKAGGGLENIVKVTGKIYYVLIIIFFKFLTNSHIHTYMNKQQYLSQAPRAHSCSA